MLCLAYERGINIATPNFANDLKLRVNDIMSTRVYCNYFRDPNKRPWTPNNVSTQDVLIRTMDVYKIFSTQDELFQH